MVGYSLNAGRPARGGGEVAHGVLLHGCGVGLALRRRDPTIGSARKAGSPLWLPGIGRTHSRAGDLTAAAGAPYGSRMHPIAGNSPVSGATPNARKGSPCLIPARSRDEPDQQKTPHLR